MKRFATRELKAAYLYAEGGGQALHVISGTYAYLRPGAPAVFKNRTQIAHLIDYNTERLIQTARSLGVRVIKVERAQRTGQHIDLCGRPLARALERCRELELALIP